jgi:phenylacetate-CoA ligase
VSKLQSVYHALPYPLKNVAASLRGYQLRWWRYSRQTEHQVEEALEREKWSYQDWELWQEERLSYVLHRAATRVPFYRKHWNQRRKNGDRASWDYLENWPVLDKDPLRENPLAFVAEDCHTRTMFREHTSGTTGKPLSLWWSKETTHAWYALFEARWRRWNNVTRKDRWGIMGGQVVAPFAQRSPPFWVWNVAFRQLYLSSYHLMEDFIPSYIEAVNNYKVIYLYGYASSLYALARGVLDQGLRAPQLKVVISNAEPLDTYQRETIEMAFGCSVKDTYGMSELVCAASECENGTMHLWPEVGVTEVFHNNDTKPLGTGQTGRLICTGLLNSDMPLIRYEVGDRGALANTSSTPCSCGRNLPILAQIEGRSDDVIITPTGRKIGRLDPVFKADLPIKEAQIIQETLSRIRVLYIPAPGFTKEDGNSIVRRLQQRVGDLEIVLEAVENIPRTANGKFRSVISLISNQDRLIS